MKPDKEERPETGKTKLDELQRKTIAKSMRNLEDILADVVADPNVKLSDNEARLVDRHLFEKTGKHFGKFKDPKPPKDKPKVKGHKLKIITKDPLDPGVLLDDKTKDIIADRIAEKVS